MSRKEEIEKVFDKIGDRKKSIKEVCEIFGLCFRSADVYYSAWVNRNKERRPVTIKDQVFRYLNKHFDELPLNELVKDMQLKMNARRDTIYKYYCDWNMDREDVPKEIKEVYKPKVTRISQKFYIDDSKLWR